jgi:MEMO1 family protein
VTTARRAAVAGQFYPGDPAVLRRQVTELLAGADATTAGPAPKAVIAPHAGYMFSGPIAASAYAVLSVRRGTVERVVLAGPAHYVPVRGVAVPSVDVFDTPLGPVLVDDDARRAALAVPGVVIDDLPHGPEHSLEVHLPFVVEVFGPVPVLPLVVGHQGDEVCAAVLDRLWGGDETCIVVSSDLSHYFDDATAKKLDRRTADAIVEGRPDDIASEDACGAAPVRGLLQAAARRGVRTTLLDLRTSADTAGSPDRVVGYGAFAFG